MKYFVVFLFLSFFIACDTFHTEFDDIENAVYFKADKIKTVADKNHLKIMTWNIKFGGGRIDFFFDCYGDRVLMTKDEVIKNMDGIVGEIKKEDPDIVFIQEADVNSKRSAYLNQVRYILNNTDLNYGVYASQWKADYIPSDGIGKVDTGNAILSKYPLENAKRIALPLMTEQSAVTRYFYLKRNILTAEVKINQKVLNLLDIHTSAYSHDKTKLKQINILKEKLDALNEENKIFIAGGDFNTVPPKSEKIKDFPDSVCTDEEFQADDYTEDLGILDDFYKDYTAAISLSDYEADNSSYFSHTTNKNGFWNRKLDYLFTNGNFSSGMVLQDEQHGGSNTMELSDHAPLRVYFEFNN